MLTIKRPTSFVRGRKSKPGFGGGPAYIAKLIKAEKERTAYQNTPALVVTEGAYRAKTRRIVKRFEGPVSACYKYLTEQLQAGNDNLVIVHADTLEEMDYGRED